ncbi:MAG: PQQ-binding-like beta-propeller repeat protein [Spirochaetia bacterium]|nr:PQQ-binding-like beta-propeller repeat protein [Spirochaetia bacterium]
MSILYKKNKKFTLLIKIIFFIFLVPSYIIGSEWPIFKGNRYFTGNNDEIIVKNNGIKWLFSADSKAINPIVSDGRVFFTDIKKNIYSLDEETGKLIWKIDLTKIASQFISFRKIMGKAKYPLVYKNFLVITDSIAIYCIDKFTGKILWARTGLQSGDYSTAKNSIKVDGIYADPFLANDAIFYGTRTAFYSRNIANGKLNWENKSIQSFSGFPAVYENFIFAQSVDYNKKEYNLYCLNRHTGQILWQNRLEMPFKIFAPLVYKEKVFMPIDSKLYSFDLTTGKLLNTKDYKEVITSNLAFTDAEMRLTLSNHKIITINSITENIKNIQDLPKQSSPKFITIRDQIYIAYSQKRISKKTGKSEYYTTIKAISLDDKKNLWSFEPLTPGSSTEMAAENGVLFVSAGNILYALGDKNKDNYKTIEDYQNRREDKIIKQPQKKRKLNLTLKKEDNENKNVEAEIIQKKDGEIISREKKILKEGDNSIEIVEGEEVEIIASDKNHFPEKIIIEKNKDKATLSLKKIKKNKNYTAEGVYFETNKAYLKKESLPMLEKIKLILKENSKLNLEIQGHTDSTGKREYNLELSRKRANAAAEYLIKNGISAERLKIKGFGPDKPIADNNTDQGRSKNRRTDFIFH